MGRGNKKEKMVYILVGILLVAAISMLMSVRAQSNSREAVLFDNRNYEAAEEMCRQQVLQVLESYDCYNSGLTMTRIVSLDGERQYNMVINNSRLQKMEKDMFEQLCNEVDACRVLTQDGKEYEVTFSFEL